MSAASNALDQQGHQQIVLLEKGDEDAWDTYVHGSDRCSIYHLSVWKKIISDLFGHAGYYFCSKDAEGKINGVLPLIRLKSRIFGDYMVSMPYFNYGGAIAEQPEIEAALMQAAAESAGGAGLSHVEFRDLASREADWKLRNDKITMILNLPESEEVLWKSLGSKRRSQIKRPLRENPEVLSGGIELLDDFYRVFTINMRDLGTPVYPKVFFERILQTFPDKAAIVSVRMQNEAVAAGFLLGFRGQLEIPWASTLGKVNPLGVNMLLYWEVLKFAIEKGYKRFDFGRCTEGSGTHKFKKQWGSEACQLNWHYWLPAGAELPQLNPNNPKYKAAISVWRKMPVFLTNWLGPKIVKNLP